MLRISVFIFVIFYSCSSYAACSSPTGRAGEYGYFTTGSTYKYCDGTNWNAFSNAGTASTCSTAGQLEYDTTLHVYKFCNGTNWIKINYNNSSCTTIGQVCSDGTMYADLSPNGNVKMYATAASTGVSMTWDDGSTNYPSSAILGANACTSSSSTESGCTTGFENTVLLANWSGSDSPLQAVQYCNNLVAQGHSDWYLPSRDEMEILFTNRVVLGMGSSSNYWTSSEWSGSAARKKSMNTGITATTAIKSAGSSGYDMRCVRKESLGTCSTEAQIEYRTDANLLEYCNGTIWIVMGP